MFRSIKSHLDFKKVYQSGNSLANTYLVLYYLRNPYGKVQNRYGITVSKKVGKAVVRNKVRRRIRELIRLNEDHIAVGYEIVFVSRVRAKDATFQELKNAFFSLLKKSGLYTEETDA